MAEPAKLKQLPNSGPLQCYTCLRPQQMLTAIVRPEDNPEHRAFWLCWECIQATAKTYQDIVAAFPHVE